MSSVVTQPDSLVAAARELHRTRCQVVSAGAYAAPEAATASAAG
jgi:hypothetical protein